MRTAKSALLAWYDREHRDLPWRQTHDPYRVLLSEIMLQQTRVEVVIPRYEQFVTRFPTLEHLVKASEDEVLAAWSGLGYYRRARNLLSAVREVDRRGSWPRTAGELALLPGLGAYTSAAVASIAFGAVVAAVDGNVERVAARVLALEEDARLKTGRDRIRRLAIALLDVERPGDSNQALMELGALVCQPRSTHCDRCPLQSLCAGRKSGNPTAYPFRRPARSRRRERRLVVVVDATGGDGRAACVLLVRRRADETVLSGMWELPWIDAAESDAQLALAERYGGRWQLEPPQVRVRHAISMCDIELLVCRGRLDSGDGVMEGREAGFFAIEELPRVATTSMVEKVLSAVARRSALRPSTLTTR